MSWLLSAFVGHEHAQPRLEEPPSSCINPLHAEVAAHPPVAMGQGGGDPAAIYAALSHFTDDEAKTPLLHHAGKHVLDGLVERRRALAKHTTKHPAFVAGDIVYEQLAFQLAYQDSVSAKDEAWLAIQGLRAGNVVHGVQGFAMLPFVPIPGSDRAPVLAFRGTDDLKDLADDLNPRGVGMYQLAANEGKIAMALAALQGYDEPVVVTGHSLGGALAQMAAARFPNRIGRVVTFQAPGIPKHMLNRIEAINEKSVAAGEGERIKSHHFAIKDDIVSLAGHAHSRGHNTEIDLPGVSFFLKHTGNHSLSTDVGATTTSAQIPFVPTPAQIETVRAGVGHVLSALARFSKVVGIDNHAGYLDVWDKVRDALDRDASFETVAQIVLRARISPQDKALMMENLNQIRATHAVRAS